MKARLATVADDSVDIEELSVDEAAAQVIEAVTDRRENGGTVQQVRAAALRLASRICESLEEDAR